jgi:hypothetical protein
MLDKTDCQRRLKFLSTVFSFRNVPIPRSLEVFPFGFFAASSFPVVSARAEPCEPKASVRAERRARPPEISRSASAVPPAPVRTYPDTDSAKDDPAEAPAAAGGVFDAAVRSR